MSGVRWTARAHNIGYALAGLAAAAGFTVFVFALSLLETVAR